MCLAPTAEDLEHDGLELILVHRFPTKNGRRWRSAAQETSAKTAGNKAAAERQRVATPVGFNEQFSVVVLHSSPHGILEELQENIFNVTLQKKTTVRRAQGKPSFTCWKRPPLRWNAILSSSLISKERRNPHRDV
jgi:hypothetical protein